MCFYLNKKNRLKLAIIINLKIYKMNLIFLIFLLINFNFLFAKKANINQVKYLDFYRDKITEGKND